MNVNSLLVTGANRGIGLCFVKKFLLLPQPPKYVFATCRSPEKAMDLQKLKEKYSNLHILKLDVADYERHKDVTAEIKEKVKDAGLNLLINNAGVMHRKSLKDVTVSDMMESYAVNAIAPLMLTKELLPLLVTAYKYGSNLNYLKALVVNISTQLASLEENRTSEYYPYRTSKAALNMIMKCLAIDVTKDGVFVVCIHPGWVRTEMGSSAAKLSPEESVDGIVAFLEKIEEKHRGSLYSYNGRLIPW